MKKYLSVDTGEIWTEEEAKEAARQFYYEAGHESPEEYFDYMIENGMIEEIEKSFYIIDDCGDIFTEKLTAATWEEAKKEAAAAWDKLTKADKGRRYSFELVEAYGTNKDLDYETISRTYKIK